MNKKWLVPIEKRIARDKDFPILSGCFGDRKAVCKRCHCVMNDFEPGELGGCFYHPTLDKEDKLHWCKNAGKTLDTSSSEIEPFLRKRDRRRHKRIGLKI
jgi:hypothetical protein